jgi:hypothetical protein
MGERAAPHQWWLELFCSLQLCSFRGDELDRVRGLTEDDQQSQCFEDAGKIMSARVRLLCCNYSSHCFFVRCHS